MVLKAQSGREVNGQLSLLADLFAAAGGSKAGGKSLFDLWNKTQTPENSTAPTKNTANLYALVKSGKMSWADAQKLINAHRHKTPNQQDAK